MGFRHFRTGAALRVCLLTGTISCICFVVFNTSWHITAIVLGLVILLQIYNLVQFVETTNRDLARFLSGIRSRDFTQNFNETGQGKTFGELRHSFNSIIDQFRKISAEKEAHYQYLNSIVENAGTGLIAFDENGSINLYNQAAARLLDMPYLTNISALSKKHPELFKLAESVKPGEKKTIDIYEAFEKIQLSILATVIKTDGQKLTLLSMQNISTELRENEIEAWQKLIKVLTHEIMNSITPIASISGSGLGLLESEENWSAETMSDIKSGLRSIENRSKGLLNFVDVYRALTRVPVPKLQAIPAARLLGDMVALMGKTLKENHVACEIIIRDQELMLFIDPELIEQVLINLILNAIDAVKPKTDKMIKLVAETNEHQRPVIMIIDNGEGISPETADKIFVPFFTTKENGTGIGLSLSQQIMKLHSGSITLKTNPGEGTVFVLTF